MHHPWSFRRLWSGLAALAIALGSASGARAQDERDEVLARAFEGARGWINSKPLRLSDLKGKIVVLDFWTYCCINCHHVLPDLARLEEKYKDVLVVIGVHSPKFPAEQVTANIKRKVDEYRIKHPVINDADQVIWNNFGVRGWPTLAIFDATGKLAWAESGEGHYAEMDHVIAGLVDRQKGLLDRHPFVFFPETSTATDQPLSYPGKVLADRKGDRLFIADTGHNRIVVTDLKGHAQATIGSGQEGLADGPFDRARFNRPQGLCLFESKLYVADTENHAIRVVDLDEKTVATVSGNGQQAQRDQRQWFKGPAKSSALNSPWDLLPLPGTRTLTVAMAGPHQIWALDLDAGTIATWAGSGIENIKDGTAETAAFAQPSGLATDGTHLFVADSEVSGVRSIRIADRHVSTIVGVGLFGFGDQDGKGDAVRLQHCLGLAYGDGHLYIADTYNNKVKACDPKTRSVRTFAGTGAANSQDSPPAFYQPGGLSLVGTTLYVADTNNHAIRTIDVKSRKVTTLALDGVAPPSPPPSKPRFPNALTTRAPAAKVAPGRQFTLKVRLSLPEGFKLNPEAPKAIRYLLEAPGRDAALDPSVPPNGSTTDAEDDTFTVNVPLAEEAKDGDQLALRLSVSAFICRSGTGALCTFQNYVWNLPVHFTEGGQGQVELTSDAPGARSR